FLHPSRFRGTDDQALPMHANVEDIVPSGSVRTGNAMPWGDPRKAAAKLLGCQFSKFGLVKRPKEGRISRLCGGNLPRDPRGIPARLRNDLKIVRHWVTEPRPSVMDPGLYIDSHQVARRHVHNRLVH